MMIYKGNLRILRMISDNNMQALSNWLDKNGLSGEQRAHLEMSIITEENRFKTNEEDFKAILDEMHKVLFD